jgi:hypothetical protein
MGLQLSFGPAFLSQRLSDALLSLRRMSTSGAVILSGAFEK